MPWKLASVGLIYAIAKRNSLIKLLINDNMVTNPFTYIHTSKLIGWHNATAIR